jgi:membrane-bound ClpP family serine protease
MSKRLADLEEYFQGDVIFFYGAIHPTYLNSFRDLLEDLKEGSSSKRLVIILNTPGGEAETVEKLVDMTRFHYEEVFFIIPDLAMSAGTIFCMSGDKIFMDYSSSLGPIDPQVLVKDQYVPALGYLDQVEKFLAKARARTLTDAEFTLLRDLDLALLRLYEQAKDLTVTLLKTWLVKYKFKDWTKHETTRELLGKQVTLEEKKQRAEDIAKKLGDNNYWHSHSRMINIETAKSYLKLKIEDYSRDSGLRQMIRSYNDLVIDYILKCKLRYFWHNRKLH